MKMETLTHASRYTRMKRVYYKDDKLLVRNVAPIDKKIKSVQK